MGIFRGGVGIILTVLFLSLAAPIHGQQLFFQPPGYGGSGETITADGGVGARSRNHADVLRWRKFERWWRNCSDWHPGRNLCDHGVCDCYGRFDYPQPQYEAHFGCSVTDRSLDGIGGCRSWGRKRYRFALISDVVRG
jgi:hypothetical protein